MLLSVLSGQADVWVPISTAEFSAADRVEAVKAAIETYGKDRPDLVVKDVTGTDSRYYGVTGLTGWVEDFSRVLYVEFPAADVSANESPQLLERDAWQDDYWAGSTRYLYLPNHTPATSQALRVAYTIPYAITGSAPSEAVSVPAQDAYAISYLVASKYCQALAAKYAKTSDSTIGVDAVGHHTRADAFAQRAREFYNMYAYELGLKREDKPVKPQSAFVDWDVFASLGMARRRRYIFHGTR